MPNYTLIRTSGENPITIGAGQVSGPSGGTAGQILDLDMYGQGALNWGQGVDQNQLRLLENFACPEVVRSSTPGDIRPVNAGDTGVPGYSPDVARGTGINRPVLGQMWFNTTNNKMYRCIDPKDGSVSAGTNPEDSIWDVVAADPDLFLPLTGGTLSDALTILNAFPRLTLASTGNDDANDVRLEFNDVGGTKGLIVLDQEIVAVGETHPNTGVVNTGSGSIQVDTMIVRKQNGTESIVDMRFQDNGVELVAGPSSIGTVTVATIRTAQTTDAMPGNTLTTKDFTDGKYVNVAGDTMTGDLFITSGSPLVSLTTLNASSNEAAVTFSDSNELKFKMVMLQSGIVDTIALEKWKSGNVAARLVFRDDYLEVENVDGNRNNGAGTIRSEATVTNDLPNTLTTKGYVEANFVNVAGDTMTGDLLITAGQPLISLTTSNATSGEAAVTFSDSNELKFKMVMLQSGLVDTIALEKWKSGVVAARLVFRDDYLEVENVDGNRNNGAGTIRSEATVTNDLPNTLTTKGYVEANFVNLPSQENGMTGPYRFGVAFEDTVITGATVVSTSREVGFEGDTEIQGSKMIVSSLAGGATEINGPTIEVTDADFQSRMTGQSFRTTDNSTTGDTYANMSATSLDMVSENGSNRIRMVSRSAGVISSAVDFYKDSLSDLRARIEYTDDWVWSKYQPGAAPLLQSRMRWSDTDIQVDVVNGFRIKAEKVVIDSDTGTSLKLRQSAQTLGNFGIDFEELWQGGSNSAITTNEGFATVSQIVYEDNGNVLAIRTRRFDILSGNVEETGEFTVSHDQMSSNKPIQLRGEIPLNSSLPYAPRMWRGSATPPTTPSSTGDLWFNTTNNRLYVRTPQTWSGLDDLQGNIPLA